MGWKDHRLIEDGEERFCVQCAEPWPCPTARLVAEVQEATLDDVRTHKAEPKRETHGPRIAWEHVTGPGKNHWVGRVNGKPLFNISHSATRNGKMVLRTTLPWGFPAGRDLAPEVEELQHRAEVVLSAFIHKLGAIWPPAQPEPVEETEA